jgi:hypothetical protein
MAAAEVAAPTGRRRRARAVFLAACALAVAGSVAAYLDASGIASTSIQPVAGAGGITGAPFDVVPTATAFTIPKGRASVVAGQEIAYVDVAVPADSNTAAVIVNWLDPQDASAVLQNPNAAIVVGLYYPVASSSACTTAADPFSQQAWYDVTQPAAAVACLAPASNSWAVLQAPTRRYQGHTTGAVIAGLPSGQSVFYVLASIVTPGHAPQGQQSSLTNLDLRLQVHGQ